METIIFSPDGEDNIHELKKFLKYVDDLRVLGKLTGEVTPCIGYYQGVLENSFICLVEDFKNYFVDWTYDQESVIKVSSDHRQPAVMHFSDGTSLPLGVYGEVYPPIWGDWWVYRKDTGKYFSFSS